MSDIPDLISEQLEEGKKSRLNSWVALSVALTATLMALGNVKDGNITQAMTQAQASGVDYWGYYQAKGTKLNIAEGVLDQLTLQRDVLQGSNPQLLSALDAKIADYKAKVAKYEAEKSDLKKKAEGFQAEYDRLNYRDDQFDLSDACFSIALALFGVTALTQKRWLFAIALIFAACAVTFEAAGFFGFSMHSEFFAKVLG